VGSASGFRLPAGRERERKSSAKILVIAREPLVFWLVGRGHPVANRQYQVESINWINYQLDDFIHKFELWINLIRCSNCKQKCHLRFSVDLLLPCMPA
jgi:hypothetical protein